MSGGLQDPDPYAALGVPKTATDKEISKAFRELALKHHPDRPGGNAETFKAINRAYEAIGNVESRARYDAGLHGSNGPSMDGMGEWPFPFPFPMRHQQQQQASQRHAVPPIVLKALVTLQQLYTGTEKKHTLAVQRVCKECRGKGGTEMETCGQCQGRGSQVIQQQFPGMLFQRQVVCSGCGGRRTVVASGKQCSACECRGYHECKEEITFRVPPGYAHGDTITLSGQGNEAVDLPRGDVVLVLQPPPPPPPSPSSPPSTPMGSECTTAGAEDLQFERHGDNLLARKKLSLCQSLCGVTFSFRSLDGRVVRVTSTEVLAPGSRKVVRGEGMPLRQTPTVKGDLMIDFDVVFPQQLTVATQRALAAALAEPNPSASTGTGTVTSETDHVAEGALPLQDIMCGEGPASSVDSTTSHHTDDSNADHAGSQANGCRVQ